jgi:hypothetical protein
MLSFVDLLGLVDMLILVDLLGCELRLVDVTIFLFAALDLCLGSMGISNGFVLEFLNEF